MKLIIFDFDGTLADSRRLIIEAHRQVFSQFGLPVPAPEASLALIGRSLELVLAELAGPEAPIAAMTTAYQPVVKALRDDPAFADLPFDGVQELLTELGRARIFVSASPPGMFQARSSRRSRHSAGANCSAPCRARTRRRPSRIPA